MLFYFGVIHEHGCGLPHNGRGDPGKSCWSTAPDQLQKRAKRALCSAQFAITAMNLLSYAVVNAWRVCERAEHPAFAVIIGIRFLMISRLHLQSFVNHCAGKVPWRSVLLLARVFVCGCNVQWP